MKMKEMETIQLFMERNPNGDFRSSQITAMLIKKIMGKALSCLEIQANETPTNDRKQVIKDFFLLFEEVIELGGVISLVSKWLDEAAQK